MLIIFGKKLLNTKKVRYALTDIFGIGYSSAHKVCNLLNIPHSVKISELTELQTQNLTSSIKQYFLVEAKLKQRIHENIENLKSINSVKGVRHRLKLPVRGQRTHSNAQTCRR